MCRLPPANTTRTCQTLAVGTKHASFGQKKDKRTDHSGRLRNARFAVVVRTRLSETMCKVDFIAQLSHFVDMIPDIAMKDFLLQYRSFMFVSCQSFMKEPVAEYSLTSRVQRFGTRYNDAVEGYMALPKESRMAGPSR